MSVVFGEWQFGGDPLRSEPLQVKSLLEPYAPDSFSKYEARDLRILYCGLHATPESRNEGQPFVTPRGAVITWTGRLDNREDVMEYARALLPKNCADVDLVAAAYERLGGACLGRLVGDWTLSVWEPGTNTLLLARDAIGSLPLYFTLDSACVTWSNALDALMIAKGGALDLDERYIAGWLHSFPEANLTPYRGISSVPPGSIVRIYRGTPFVSAYWEFDPGKRIRYASDGDYEEHFRWLFRQSVARRLRAGGPILAELSGGVDSSSIVCMADLCIQQELAATTGVNTISYYDDSEPNWNERKHFSIIEELRGRAGTHIDCARARDTLFDFQLERLAPIPACAANGSKETQDVFKQLAAEGHRVILSGIGGDEVLGGVPTPLPELEELLLRMKFSTLFRQLRHWSLATRKPAVALLAGALRRLCPLRAMRCREAPEMDWLDPHFRRRNRDIFQARQPRISLTGVSPVFQENLETLDSLKRQLACQPLLKEPAYEKRYPYLDRDLLEFLLAVPRQQIARPGDRRSLMRRALSGIVPAEVLYQKRKAFAVRGPMGAVIASTGRLLEDREHLLIASLGFVAPERVSNKLKILRSGESTQIVPLIRILGLEGWLRNLRCHGIISASPRDLKDGFAEQLGKESVESAAVLRSLS